ncbi:MAG: hypothetical protein QXE18_05970 [Thermoplasmata archaeon]
MIVTKRKPVVTLGVVVGIVLIAVGSISIASGLEYGRSLRGEQVVQPLHVYSFSFHSSAASEVHIEFNLSKGDMNVLITNMKGHDEVLETGYPSESNLLVAINDTSQDSIDWTPNAEGTYYVHFMMFSEESANLDIEISYTGAEPELVNLGIILMLLGTVIALIDSLLKGRASKKETPETNRSESLENPDR